MASVAAMNAKYGGKVFWWENIGADTPTVWKYTCSVDTHQLVSVQRLTSADAVCPAHGVALTGEGAVSVA